MPPQNASSTHITVRDASLIFKLTLRAKFVRRTTYNMLGLASHFVVTNWFKLMLNSNKNDLQRLCSHIFKQCRTRLLLSSMYYTHKYMLCMCVVFLFWDCWQLNDCQVEYSDEQHTVASLKSHNYFSEWMVIIRSDSTARMSACPI